MKSVFSLAALAALAACGSDKKDDETFSGTITDDNGETAEYSLNGDSENGGFSIKTKDGELNITANADGDATLPFGLKLLPGSSVKSNVQMNQGGKGTNGGMVTFESNLSPDKIVAYYKKQVTSAGFKIGTELKSGKMMMFNATRDESHTINVSATADDNGKTTGNIIAGSKK